MMSSQTVCNFTIQQLLDFKVNPFEQCPSCKNLVSYHLNEKKSQEPEVAGNLSSLTQAPSQINMTTEIIEIDIDATV